jgi:hypothetical protein
MIFDGIRVRLVRGVTFRLGTPDDRDLYRNPVSPNYVVFVRENGDSIPVAYGGTGYGYGVDKVNLNDGTRTCDLWVAHDGRVYCGKIRHSLVGVASEQG